MADATIRIDVTGTNKVALRFAEFPEDLRAALRQEIEALANELGARVVAAAPRKTGRLQSQVRVRLFDDANSIKGYVDIGGGTVNDIIKAATLEFGSTGDPIEYTPAPREDRRGWLGRFLAPQDAIQKKLRKSPNIAAHRFERGPLAEMQPEIAARLNAVVEAEIARANA